MIFDVFRLGSRVNRPLSYVLVQLKWAMGGFKSSVPLIRIVINLLLIPLTYPTVNGITLCHIVLLPELNYNRLLGSNISNALGLGTLAGSVHIMRLLNLDLPGYQLPIPVPTIPSWT